MSTTQEIQKENTHIEGLDSVGKGTAVKAALSLLLFSKHVYYKGKEIDPKNICVIETDFPQYWSIGALIRKMNSAVGRTYFEEKGYHQEEVLHLRKAMYAIDRLLTLIVKESIETDPSRLYVQISDRGPLSPAITHAVCFEGNRDAYIRSMPSVDDADMCYIHRVNPKSVLLLASESGIGGGGGRGELDELEKPTYQELSRLGFEELMRDPNRQITPIVTRNGKEWRNKTEIGLEILASIGITCEGMPDIDSLAPGDFADKKRTKAFVQLGATQLIEALYPSLVAEFRSHTYAPYDTPIHSAIAEILNYDTIRHVQYFHRAGDDYKANLLQHAAGADDKKVLLLHEERNALTIAQLLSIAPIEYPHIAKEIREYSTFLLTEYTGGELLELINFLESHLRDSRHEQGYSTLLKQLFLPDARVW